MKTTSKKMLFSFIAAAIIFLLPLHKPLSAQTVRAGRLPIPPAATVLTLTGLNFNLVNYMPDVLQGRFSKPPYRLREVRYPASISPKTISKGVLALDAALRDTAGPIIVLAHSQGAQVASHWMRQHAADPNAPAPNRLIFILLGNPLRLNGGHGIGQREFGGTIGEPTPTCTPWTVVDVARRYDGWADFPADASNQLAVRNANIGKRTYHTHYDVVDIDDPTNTVWKQDNTTFVLTHETLPLWHRGFKPPTLIQRETIASVESAYNRPPNDLRLAPLPVPGMGQLWHQRSKKNSVISL
ncbi:MAG: PE-PPE domain-containing protein [Cyanobacteria bacterium SZAS-4]|nr:PE-PPE domain-containing protein [Cyanobacteria bacterium SZAS-4]